MLSYASFHDMFGKNQGSKQRSIQIFKFLLEHLCLQEQEFVPHEIISLWHVIVVSALKMS